MIDEQCIRNDDDDDDDDDDEIVDIDIVKTCRNSDRKIMQTIK